MMSKFWVIGLVLVLMGCGQREEEVKGDWEEAPWCHEFQRGMFVQRVGVDGVDMYYDWCQLTDREWEEMSHLYRLDGSLYRFDIGFAPSLVREVDGEYYRGELFVSC